MNSLLKVACWFLCLALFQNGLAQESYYLKQEVTHEIVREGNTTGQDKSVEEFYLSNDYFVFVSKDRRILIKNKANEIILVDEKNKTYLTTTIPYEPMNILTDVSALRFLEESKVKGILERKGAERQISDYRCLAHTLSLETRYPQTITFWTTTGLSLTDEMKTNLKEFRKIKYYNCEDAILSGLSDVSEWILEYEISEQRNNERLITSAVCKEFSKKAIPQELLADDDSNHSKDKITYSDLVNEKLGKKSKIYNSEELAVLDVIKKFHEGYRRRDIEYVDEWVEELFAEDAFILGTDASWPDSWEWRSGHEAAKEMFERDWRRWGDVKIFDDEIFVNVDRDAAWVTAFATVNMYRDDDDRSRQRSLSRINEYIREGTWTSRRAIYEIIADASSVLAQYERGFRFVTPMRTEFGLVKRDGKWLLKMVHFSHPARGFRSFRLLNADPKLLEKK